MRKAESAKAGKRKRDARKGAAQVTVGTEVNPRDPPGSPAFRSPPSADKDLIIFTPTGWHGGVRHPQSIPLNS